MSIEKNVLIVLCFIILLLSCQSKTGNFVCPPCDLPCDTLVFENAGVCPHCEMKLISKNDLLNEEKLALNEINMSAGSGIFLVEGSASRKNKNVKVHYHMPEGFGSNSKILFVIPGAGRNGDSYRDAWIAESEKYNVLILSLEYNEEDYSFEDYHLCGLISNSNFRESIEYVKGTNQVILQEDSLRYVINLEKDSWLFNDFDRIFDLVRNQMDFEQNEYDLFGHSAGGQILHRFAILSEDSKAHRIVSSNSGFYTLPNREEKMPFGIQEFSLDDEDLKNIFNKRLILLIGKLDNANETGGTLLRSEMADQQGLHRLARSNYFYDYAKEQASRLDVAFNWFIKIVPNAGHNHELMGNAAAKLLYEMQ